MSQTIPLLRSAPPKHFLQNKRNHRAENYEPGYYREQDAFPICGKREHDEDFTP